MSQIRQVKSVLSDLLLQFRRASGSDHTRRNLELIISDFISKATEIIKKGHDITDEDYRTVVYEILTTVLTKGNHGNVLLSTGWSSLLELMMTSPGDVNTILVGMNDVIWQMKEPDFYQARTLIIQLIISWFNPKKLKFQFKPYFLYNLFKLLSRYNNFEADRLLSLDSQIFPIVKSALQYETRISLNVRNSKSQSILHVAAGVLNLPDVTAEILRHPDISVNVTDEKNQTPVLLLISQNVQISNVHLKIFRILLSHRDIDLFMTSQRQGITSKLFHHFRNQPSILPAVFDMINTLLQHRQINMETCMDLLSNFLSWNYPNFKQDKKYLDTFRYLISCPVFHLDGLTTTGVDKAKTQISPIEMCLQQISADAEQLPRLLTLLTVVSEELIKSNMTSSLIEIFRGVYDVTASDQLTSMIKGELLHLIISTDIFPLDIWIKPGYPAAHLAATAGDAQLVRKILLQSRYNPETLDREGNTALFLICVSCPQEVVWEFLRMCSWNFRVRNRKQENVYDYYMKKVKLIDLNLKERLFKLCNSAPVINIVNVWKPINTYNVKVEPSMPGFVRWNIPLIQQKRIYNMKGSRKGKALVIGIEDEKDPDMKGAEIERNTLINLWHQIGFDVYIPQNNRLPAKALQAAVEEFTSLLDETDQCSVLCIIAHGTGDAVCGSDSVLVSRKWISDRFNNINCQKMAGKPKIIMIDACRGTHIDPGIEIKTPEDELDAANYPTLSDVILCQSTSLDHLSLYSKQNGSPFIKTVVEVLSTQAKDEDFQAMLTQVCQRMSVHVGSVRTDAGLVQQTMMMPHTESTLTKSLYFLPCPGGKTGRGWQEMGSKSTLV